MKGIRETLTINQILEWADLHQLRTGKWPTSRTGRILDCPERTWESIQTALAKGTCGLPGGSSLHQLLRRRRKKRDARIVLPDLSVAQILRWVDSHWARTGKWPRRDDGPVADQPEISWGTIDRRMRDGEFGLAPGTTLSKWLRQVRGIWDGGKPRMTERIVLRWAEEHFAHYGRWPVTMSGALFNHPDENWAAIDVALRNARRGFPYKTSLSKLLESKFGERYQQNIGMPKQRVRQARARFVRISRV
jgi:hypothetical protein